MSDITVTSDATGQYLGAVVYYSGIYSDDCGDEGNVFTSNDYGTTWVLQTSAPCAYWTSVTSDASGDFLVATIDDGGIWRIYANYGAPTSSPTSSPSSVLPEDEINTDIPWTFTVCTLTVASSMAIFGAIISDHRRNNKVVYQIDGVWVQYALIAFGIIFSSQCFFIYTCFTETDDYIYGIFMVVIKACAIVLNGLHLYQSTRNIVSNLDWELISEKKTWYSYLGFFCCLQSKLMFLMPWHASEATFITGGFPSFRMYFISTCILLLESLCIVVVQLMFGINIRSIFDQSLSTRVSFLLSTGCTIVNSMLVVIEMRFVRSSYEVNEAKNGSRPSCLERNISDTNKVNERGYMDTSMTEKLLLENPEES